jgi:hypothetical protein
VKLNITSRDQCAQPIALSKIASELGQRVGISGDVVVSQDGPDEIWVTKILSYERVCYSRVPLFH